jgi:hypothetical protein
MKLALAFCAAAGLASFAGTAALHRVPEPRFQQESAIVVPAWLALPYNDFVTSIEYNGDPGSESTRGAVTLDLPSDGQAEMVGLTAHFQAHGYQLERRTLSLDQFGGNTAVVRAVDQSTGRLVTFVNIARADGATLRISFDEAQPDQLAEAM